MIKSYILFLLILATINGENFTLSGQMKFCDSKSNSFGKPLKLLKNNQVVKNKIVPDYSGEFTIDNLEKGEYVIEYENIYKQIIRKKINLENSQTSIELCLDDFIDTKISTLFNTLKDGDSLSINIDGAGCFHSFEDKMTFYRKKGKYFAETKNAKYKTIVKSIDAEKLNYLILWEKQAKQINKVDGFCTSNAFYEFKLNSVSKFKVHDGTCNWDGYTKVRSKIFGF
ncbi:MAG: hypothetical protein H7221_08870 [Flavobacterium sp.]|nr:hypothetical protein [Flavobacterium sp.]